MVKGKLLCRVDTYEKHGEQKNKHVELGVLMEGQHGEYGMIEPTVSLAGVLAQQNALAAKEGKPPRARVMFSVWRDQPQQGGDPYQQ